MEDKERNFYDKIRDAVSAYLLHDPNAQAVTAFEREKKKKTVDDKTLAMFQESAEAGHPFSCFNLGRCYETGNGVEQDLEKAYEWYRKAAVGGDANAWLALAKMFDKGIYVDRDPKEAAMWLSRAADKDHPIAKIGMGQKYSRGDGVDKDPAKALEYFREAQKLDPGIGSYILGEAIGDGIGCEKDYEEAFRLFQIAHEHKFPLGTYNIGMMYEMGLGVEKDEQKGFELLTQAADEGVAEAMYRLAFHYRDGTSEAGQDSKTAFEYYKKAADKGFPPAMVEAGICYENGFGVEMNKEEAFRWYEKAAATGLHTAIVCLAVCYKAGIGCEIDDRRSMELLEEAVTLGNSRAYHLLAQYLLEDDPYDERAINLEMVSARSGFIRSAMFLGGYFIQKSEVGPDKEKAAYYFRIAAREGDTSAKFELAELLDTEENRKDQKSLEEIWQLYEESAEAGHPLAAYKMALRFKDPEERVSEVPDFPSDRKLSPEKRKEKEVHYISIAASGGIPAACHEMADRCFWGDGTAVDVRSASGLYGYAGDEMDNRSLQARSAFCRIVVQLEYVYRKAGRYDRVYAETVENYRKKIVGEDEKWKLNMQRLTDLAKENVPDAMIFLPLAKALSYGEKTDLSSEEDQECLSFIDSLPDSRDKYYVKGLLMVILHPEKIQSSIKYLRYAAAVLEAGNVDQTLGNLYHSLAIGPGKLRKGEIKVIEGPIGGPASVLNTNEVAQIKEKMKYARKTSLWSEGSTWKEKKNPSKLDLMNTATELYLQDYRSSRNKELRSYLQSWEEVHDLTMYRVLPGMCGAVFMVFVLVTLLIALIREGTKTDLRLDAVFRRFGSMFVDGLVWVILAILLLIALMLAVTDIQKYLRRQKMKKLPEEPSSDM